MLSQERETKISLTAYQRTRRIYLSTYGYLSALSMLKKRKTSLAKETAAAADVCLLVERENNDLEPK